MDFLTQDVMQAIGSLGFPIVAYFMMQHKLSAQITKNTEAIQSLTEVVKLMRETR